MYESLKNKKILITGGSRGIGAAIAQVISEQGAQVAITYSKNQQKAQETLNNLKGDQHCLLHLDLNDPLSIDKCIHDFLNRYEHIDGLVNNAGLTQDQLLLRMSLEDFKAPIDANLIGSFLCTKGVIRAMLKKRYGSIVNITSVIGHTGNSGQSNYSASKAALTGFTKSLAQEIGSRNIRVNCIAPGFIKTDMTQDLSELQKKQLLDKVPLHSLGEPVDVAFAAAFLLSDESKYITGQTIHVNGGMYMN